MHTEGDKSGDHPEGHDAHEAGRSGQRVGPLRALRGSSCPGPDFMPLANALSALYPKEREEKRLLDAMLLVVPR